MYLLLKWASIHCPSMILTHTRWHTYKHLHIDRSAFHTFRAVHHGNVNGPGHSWVCHNGGDDPQPWRLPRSWTQDSGVSSHSCKQSQGNFCIHEATAFSLVAFGIYYELFSGWILFLRFSTALSEDQELGIFLVFFWCLYINWSNSITPPHWDIVSRADPKVSIGAWFQLGGVVACRKHHLLLVLERYRSMLAPWFLSYPCRL